MQENSNYRKILDVFSRIYRILFLIHSLCHTHFCPHPHTHSSISTRKTTLQGAHSKRETSRDWSLILHRSVSRSSVFLRTQRRVIRNSQQNAISVSPSSQIRTACYITSSVWSVRRKTMEKPISGRSARHFCSTLLATSWKSGEMSEPRDTGKRYWKKWAHFYINKLSIKIWQNPYNLKIRTGNNQTCDLQMK